MKTRILIIAIFAILSVIFLYGVYQPGLSDKASGILANLGTGFVGTALTVLIVDWLYERRETARQLPKRIVVHEDVRLLVARSVGFWFNAYMASVPGELPTSIAHLVQPESIDKIRGHLDMNSVPNVTPRRTWWQFLPEQTIDLKNLAEKILHRHSEILDPEAYRSVSQLAQGLLDPNIINGIRASDQEMGFPRPQILGNYFFVLDEYFPSLLMLVRWCNKEAEEIKRAAGFDAMLIDENLVGNRPEGTPKCMVAPEELARQFETLAAFREAHESAAEQ
jgi:hypothetical protein